MNDDNKHISIDRGEIYTNIPVTDGHFLLGVALPDTFPTPLPGQFVMVRNLHNGNAMLSRPFSVFGFRKEGQRVILELLCRISGEETLRLSKLKTGADVEITGPLGSGFSLSSNVNNIIVVAGGVGVAPLSFFLKELARSGSTFSITAFLGAKTAELAYLFGKCLVNASPLYLATDDGTLDYHGPVTDLLAEELPHIAQDISQIFACGPTPMTRELAHILAGSMIRCQVSLEERMACGVGACLGCVVLAKGADGTNVYKRVCKEGPVFDIREIVWQ